jgi:hypothetical protein
VELIFPIALPLSEKKKTLLLFPTETPLVDDAELLFPIEQESAPTAVLFCPNTETPLPKSAVENAPTHIELFEETVFPYPKTEEPDPLVILFP